MILRNAFYRGYLQVDDLVWYVYKEGMEIALFLK